MYTLYTDGSCTNNGMANSFGGWAWVLVKDEENTIVAKDKGMEAPTTNNRMELLAVISGLEWIKSYFMATKGIKIVADSKYVLDAFRQDWIAGWRRRNWKNAKNKPILNMDLWTRLISLVEELQPEWEHVHGHTGHLYNEMCDKLAAEASRS